MDKWGGCYALYKEDELLGTKLYCGLDLSSTTDTTAFVGVGRTPEGKIRLIQRVWVPEANLLKREEKDRVPYSLWTRQRFIKATPGDVVDYGIVRKDLKDLGDRFDIAEIAYDRWNSSGLVTNLQDDNFELVKFGQGMNSMSAPTKELLTLILGQVIEHPNDPVLNWMMSNLTVRQDEHENVKPIKPKSAKRIDAVVALIMALARLLSHSDKKGAYENRGVEYF